MNGKMHFESQVQCHPCLVSSFIKQTLPLVHTFVYFLSMVLSAILSILSNTPGWSDALHFCKPHTPHGLRACRRPHTHKHICKCASVSVCSWTAQMKLFPVPSCHTGRPNGEEQLPPPLNMATKTQIVGICMDPLWIPCPLCTGTIKGVGASCCMKSSSFFHGSILRILVGLNGLDQMGQVDLEHVQTHFC